MTIFGVPENVVEEREIRERDEGASEDAATDAAEAEDAAGIFRDRGSYI
jgi:hypothetical protein